MMRRFIVNSVASVVLAATLSGPEAAQEEYTFTTLAGVASIGSADGKGNAARFSGPAGVAVDSAGNVYVADRSNITIRKITPGGVVSTLAGLAGNWGSTDGAGSAARFEGPIGVAVDSAANVYVADHVGHTIRKITPGGVVSTLAGLARQIGNADGTGSAARFTYPTGVVVDSAGNVYVADNGNHTIRKITTGGVVSTFAGSSGNRGSADGTGSAARFDGPRSVAVDSAGNVYVADTGNRTIRKITPSRVVSTVAGMAGIGGGGADGTGNAARFYSPFGVAVDSAANVYVADYGSHTIRKITPGGVVSTLAGSGLPSSRGITDGTGSAARFYGPQGVAVDSMKNVYVADTENNVIRKGAPSAVVSSIPPSVTGQPQSQTVTTGTNVTLGVTVSGTPPFNYQWRKDEVNILAATNASFKIFSSQTSDSGAYSVQVSNAFGSTESSRALLTVKPSETEYTFVTLAGQSSIGNEDGAGSAARFNNPRGVAVDSAGNLYAADRSNHTIRKITPDGGVSTLAGLAESNGSADGTGSAARFHGPVDVAVDSGGSVYVADTDNCTVRKITPSGVVTTLAGRAGKWGSSDGIGSGARFNYPRGLAVDNAGNIYVVDAGSTIRKITPGGEVTTLAGRALSFGATDGTGSAARFNQANDVALDIAGNVYVADSEGNTIRKITPGGEVSTLAGLANNRGSTGGTGSAARFSRPMGVAVDGLGNLYVADAGNHSIRKITPGGIVSTLAGIGSNGDIDGSGNQARFYSPESVAVDSTGNVYVADTGNNLVRKITPARVVSTLAGTKMSYGYRDGVGNEAQFTELSAIALDRANNAYVADWVSRRIRKVTPAGQVTTVAGSGSGGSEDGLSFEAQFESPQGVAVDVGSNVYVADSENHTIRKITSSGIVSTVAGLAGSSGYRDGIGSAARFNYPQGVAVDSGGSIYVTEYRNHTIRKITPGGIVSTLAGAAVDSDGDGVNEGAFADGTGSAAGFNYPTSVAVDKDGNVYVADTNNNLVRKITPDGIVSTLAGRPGDQGNLDGAGSGALFREPRGIAVDTAGNVYVADTSNFTIRMVTPEGVVSTLGGFAGTYGSADGLGIAARFGGLWGIAVDGGGNIYVVDNNHTVRRSFFAAPDRPVIDQREGPVGTARRLDISSFTANSYSWTVIRHPGGSTAQLSSATAKNPTFTPDVSDLYVFRLAATNAAGAISIRTIEFEASESSGPPFISSPPQGQTVSEGTVVTFNVQAVGAAPFSYQWRKDRLSLAGATNASYSIPNAQTNHAGAYSVTVSNAIGSVTSAEAVLTVISGQNQSITFGTPPNPMFGDAPFQINATSSSGLPVAFSLVSGPARLTNGTVHLAGSGTVTIRASQSGNGNINPALPVERTFTVADAAVQRLSTTQGAAVAFTVLATNVQGLEYSIQTPPSRGTAVVDAGIITFTPFLVFFGTDTFTYAVRDLVSGTVTAVPVSVTVNPVMSVFRIGQANYDVNEESNVVNITVYRNVSVAATVEYTTTRGTAVEVNGGIGDYTHSTGILSFGSGETNRVVSIPVNDDQSVEPDEFFSFRIYNPSTGSIGTPNTAVIRVIDNDTANGSLLFTDIRYPNPRPLSVGRLKLDLLPADSGGLWRFVGQYDWHASGEIVGGLPDGVHSVEFNGVAGSYIQPAPMEVTISGGTLVSGNAYYLGTEPRTGNLIVNLSPSVVANAPVITQRGQWRRKGESAWRDSGTVRTNLNQGAHVIEFKPVEGYARPTDLTVNVVANTSLAYSAAYSVSETTPGLPPTVVPVSSIDLPNFPYAFSGQIATEAGAGSGFVVKERVVLTAAHVVYDDSKFDFAKQVRWYFQRYRGSYEPKAEKPRGWYVSDSYSSQRKLENTPGVSTPRAKNLDVAALYFTAPAGRGGYGGYLASNADNNEWLVAGATGSRAKILCGYPIDNIAGADQGKLHATAINLFDFTQVFQRVYKTTEIKSYGGNSGGPLCVEYNGRYYPAAIFLGGSGQLDVRAIDSLVVDLINRAEVSGNGGENNTSGGVITFAPVLTDTVTGFGYLTVQMEPAAAVNAGAGWRIVGGNPAFVRSAVSNLPLVDGDYNLEFADASGFSKPPISPVQIFPGTNTTFLVRYEPANKAMLTLDLAGGLRLQGNRGSTFRVESKRSLDPAQPWETFATITLTGDTQAVPGFQLQGATTRFFRAILITP